jgi:hypothetical protein
MNFFKTRTVNNPNTKRNGFRNDQSGPVIELDARCFRVRVEDIGTNY